jgi:hypothetical protein
VTTPFERTRAILETRRLLEMLLDPVRTPGVSTEVREYARKLLRHYPDNASVRLAHLALPNTFGTIADACQQMPGR